MKTDMIEAAEKLSTYISDFEMFGRSASARRSDWLKSIREDAFAQFQQLGFPSTREDDWRYTNVAPISRVPFRRALSRPNGLTSAELSNFTFGELEGCQLVFVDGAFSQKLSTLTTLPRGMRVRSMATALQKDRDRLEPYLAKLAGFDRNAFTALNTAFMSHGAFVYLTRGIIFNGIIHLLFLSTGHKKNSVTHPRTLIVAGEETRVSIVESHVGLEDGIYFTNAVTEIVAARNSTIEYHKIQRESRSAFHVASLHVLQERDTNFTSHSISLGGALARNDINIVLNAEGAESTLNGLYVTAEKQHVDNHTNIDHAKPNCRSRELYKGILDEQSTGVFNGKILVRMNAQKTSAKQTNKNLLLSDHALVNSTPQLEIFADDVKCTHGATIGHLDEDELFYMRSRGIDEVSARTLLTYAFASEILSAVRIKPIQCQIDLVLLTRLNRLQEDSRNQASTGGVDL
jgi:Fe-S cluster assembly protein SufD